MKRVCSILAITGFIIGIANFPPSFAGPQVNDPAPQFTLPDSGGTNHSLSDFTGRVVLLNFWKGT